MPVAYAVGSRIFAQKFGTETSRPTIRKRMYRRSSVPLTPTGIYKTVGFSLPSHGMAMTLSSRR